MAKTLVERLLDHSRPATETQERYTLRRNEERAEAAAEITRLASRIEELERAQADLAADLERRARTCERLNPKAHDGPSYHRLDGKAQAYRHAAELARQTHSDKG